MKHLDLFSGIGGFALAVDRVWPQSKHTFCDIDPFCQQVLKKHWPNSKIYGDIKQLIADAGGQESGRVSDQSRQKSKPFGRCDLLTGGFPCQPFSQAGSRKGTEDNRYLWPEMFKIIQFAKPTWIVAENVSGLVTWNDGMVLEQVCVNLESEGYEVQAFIIQAASVNAPHRRDRVWIIAQNTRREPVQGAENSLKPRFEAETKNAPESQRSAKGDRVGVVANPNNERLERRRQKRPRHGGQPDRERSTKGRSWDENWFEVATELCRVDARIPNRVDRLKSLGNSIVPQVAEQILKAIKTYDRTRKN